MRGEFTQKVAQDARKKFGPGMNVIVTKAGKNDAKNIKNLGGKFEHKVVNFKKSIGVGSVK
jgi:hypothetical protein